MTAAIAFIVTGNGLLLAVVVARRAGRITDHALNGWLAITNASNLIGCVLVHDMPVSAGLACGFAWSLWAWWKGGGGDGTRRRLREWARKFQGVRRTAPVGAS